MQLFILVTAIFYHFLASEADHLNPEQICIEKIINAKGLIFCIPALEQMQNITLNLLANLVAVFPLLKSDRLELKHNRTDPDSSAHRTVTELYTDKVTKAVPQYTFDTLHLDENQRRYIHIRRKPAVLKMMPGLTKRYQETMRNRYSTDMSMRFKAEFASTSERGVSATQSVVFCSKTSHSKMVFLRPLPMF